MAHYDIYRSLGLDPAASTAELDRELSARLEAAAQDDPAAVDEVSTARAVLGNDARRRLYDQRLNDPSAPEIDVAAIKELAALDVGEQQGPQDSQGVPSSHSRPGQFQQQAGQFARTAGGKATVAGKQVQSSFKQSKGLAIGVTAVVTAAVVLLIGWGLGALSGGSGSTNFSGAQNTVDDMLENNTDDLRSWLQDNTFHEYRDDVLSIMNVSESGSSDFSGMDAFFSGSGLYADTGMSIEQLAMVSGESVDDFYEEAEDGVTREEADSSVAIGIRDSSDNFVGVVSLAERDGDYKVIDVSRN